MWDIIFDIMLELFVLNKHKQLVVQVVADKEVEVETLQNRVLQLEELTLVVVEVVDQELHQAAMAVMVDLVLLLSDIKSKYLKKL